MLSPHTFAENKRPATQHHQQRLLKTTPRPTDSVSSRPLLRPSNSRTLLWTPSSPTTPSRGSPRVSVIGQSAAAPPRAPQASAILETLSTLLTPPPPSNTCLSRDGLLGQSARSINANVRRVSSRSPEPREASRPDDMVTREEFIKAFTSKLAPQPMSSPMSSPMSPPQSARPFATVMPQPMSAQRLTSAPLQSAAPGAAATVVQTRGRSASPPAPAMPQPLSSQRQTSVPRQASTPAVAAMQQPMSPPMSSPYLTNPFAAAMPRPMSSQRQTSVPKESATPDSAVMSQLMSSQRQTSTPPQSAAPGAAAIVMQTRAQHVMQTRAQRQMSAPVLQLSPELAPRLLPQGSPKTVLRQTLIEKPHIVTMTDVSNMTSNIGDHRGHEIVHQGTSNTSSDNGLVKTTEDRVHLQIEQFREEFNSQIQALREELNVRIKAELGHFHTEIDDLLGDRFHHQSNEWTTSMSRLVGECVSNALVEEVPKAVQRELPVLYDKMMSRDNQVEEALATMRTTLSEGRFLETRKTTETNASELAAIIKQLQHTAPDADDVNGLRIDLREALSIIVNLGKEINNERLERREKFGVMEQRIGHLERSAICSTSDSRVSANVGGSNELSSMALSEARTSSPSLHEPLQTHLTDNRPTSSLVNLVEAAPPRLVQDSLYEHSSRDVPGKLSLSSVSSGSAPSSFSVTELSNRTAVDTHVANGITCASSKSSFSAAKVTQNLRERLKTLNNDERT